MKKAIKRWVAGILVLTSVLWSGGTAIYAEESLASRDEECTEAVSDIGTMEEAVSDIETVEEVTAVTESEMPAEVTEVSVGEEETSTEAGTIETEIQEETEEPMLSAQGTPEVEVTSINSNTGEFTIRVSGVTLKSGESVIIPVWQDSKQKDIIWNTAKADGSDYVVREKVAAHGYRTGTYHIHVYKKSSSGSMTFLTNSKLDINPEAASISVAKNGNSESITLSDVKLYGVENSVKVAVWSGENGQDDLKWYSAVKQTDGNWTALADLANHSGNGTYYAHAYVYTKTGTPVFLQSTDFLVGTALAGTVTVTEPDETGAFTVTVSGIVAPNGIKSIQIPIWSRSDQSDIVWYKAEKSGNAYVVKGNLSKHNNNTGTYHIHVYLTDTAGSMKLLTSTKMQAQASAVEPSAGSFSVTADGGEFVISAKNPSASFTIRSATIPVWSKSDQSDIVWYKAVKEGDSYVVRSDISAHQFHTGTYQAHLYLAGADGKLVFSDKISFSTTLKYTELKAVSTDGQKNFKITLSGLQTFQTSPQIRFAVWSKENGQDDLKWYTASGSSKAYSASVPVRNHGAVGEYVVHAYVYWPNGTHELAGTDSFTVDAQTVDEVTVSNINNAQGTFDITVMLGDDSGVTGVQTAVWSESDQSDIYWYKMQKQTNGSWTAKMDKTNHNSNIGTFHVHSYAVTSTGMKMVGATTAVLREENRIVSQKISETSVKITVYGATVNGKPAVSVQCPTWSQVNGQDDLVWYAATKQADGSYQATIDLSRHKHEGLFYTHVYASDGKSSILIGSVNSTLANPQPVREFDEEARAVMRKIIYAVETGGQVYGNVRYNCFVEAYTNSTAETAISIGAAGWFATNAKNLLNLIRAEDPETFSRLDTADIGKDLDTENWKYYGGDGAGGRTILKGSDKALAIQAIISSAAGIAVQDRLVDEQMVRYADLAKAQGVTDLKARLFCANLHHLAGYNAMVRVINYCKDDGEALTMENLWTNMREREAGSSNLVGADKYASRHKKVMSWLDMYL